MKLSVLVVFLAFLGCEGWGVPDGMYVLADTAHVATMTFEYIPSETELEEIARLFQAPSSEQLEWLRKHGFVYLDARPDFSTVRKDSTQRQLLMGEFLFVRQSE